MADVQERPDTATAAPDSSQKYHGRRGATRTLAPSIIEIEDDDGLDFALALKMRRHSIVGFHHHISEAFESWLHASPASELAAYIVPPNEVLLGDESVMPAEPARAGHPIYVGFPPNVMLMPAAVNWCLSSTTHAPPAIRDDAERIETAIASLTICAPDPADGFLVANRVRELVKTVEEEGEHLKIASLEQFVSFWLASTDIRVPSLVSSNEGHVQAVWTKGVRDHLAIEFRGGDSVHIVAFTPNASGQVDRIAGDYSFKNIHGMIKTLAGNQCKKKRAP